MNQLPRVTMIDQLPDLTDLDNNQHAVIPTRERENNYDKYIRNSHRPLQESGMISNNQNINQNIKEDETFLENNNFNDVSIQDNNFKKYILPNGSPSCIDVANHIELCPICSRYYKQDNSLYIIVIVVLSILCILLAKKVLK
tara:strand:+ start:1839 stop:2264 length:426 start_codon:yes stop_codon:yes gene_type:complete